MLIISFLLGLSFIPFCTICEFKIRRFCGMLKFANNENEQKLQNITPYMRWEIGSDQWYRCASCWNILNPSTFELDHIRPTCDEVNNTRKNLQLLCRLCHGIKTAHVDRPIWLTLNRKKKKHVNKIHLKVDTQSAFHA